MASSRRPDEFSPRSAAGNPPSRPTLIVALDYPEPRPALELRHRLEGLVDFYKVGHELFTAAGPEVIHSLRRSRARVFLDLKYHDIPTTVGRAVAAACRLGATIIDVHASGGAAMMRAAADAASASAVETKPLVFGVTVLTHLEDSDLSTLGFRGRSEAQALRWARLARDCGLDGVVASARESVAIRKATDGRLAILVPAVRPAWAGETHDQRRVATPAEAASSGARFVVVGRAITAQPDPREAASRVLEELSSA